MKNVIMVFLFSFLLVNSLLSQTTYYVASSDGNDSNPGTSQSLPWQSIEKLNSTSFSPGDQILMKRGDVWQSSVSLSIKSSGTENNRIVIGAYDTGSKPIITQRVPINATWIQYNQNVWYIPTHSSNIPIERMWFNNVEKEQAKSVWDSNWDGTDGVCAEHPFYHSLGESQAKLYVYATSDPNSFYNSIEYQGGLLSATNDYHTFQLIDADYVTIDGLDIQGGGYGALGLAGSDYVIIKNCDLGKNSSRAAIFANSNQINFLAQDQTSDYGQLYNCNVNSHWNYTLKFYTSLTPYGILIGWGASNWDIHDNYIKDWWFGIYTGTGENANQKSFYHKIYNNEIESPNFSYGKGIQITSWDLPGTGFYTWCLIYNNYIHNIRAAGMSISSSGNKVCFNIIDSIDVSRCPEKGDQSNSGMGIELVIDHSWGLGGTLDSNYIFNNTFYRLNRTSMNWYDPFTYNNLFLQNSMSTSHALTISQSSFNYKNNLFYKSGSNSSTTFIWKAGTSDYYSIPTFNSLGGNISGNIYPVGKTLFQIMNSNYTLLVGSPALNAGIDISSLIPEGFTDRLGNAVNRTNPDIGAIQFTSASDLTPPRLISAVLLDPAKLLLKFSEPLSQSGVTTLSNYNITNGISIQSAQLNTNQTEITLFTTAHAYGQSYTATVNNLEDLAGNPIQSANNSSSYQNNFNPPPSGMTKLLIVKATASDTDNVNYGPDKTIDGLYFSNGGNPFSRWAAIPCPQWLIYDLGMIKQINKTKLSFYEFQNGRIYNYSISISNDKVNWINVVSNALSSNQEFTDNAFDQVEARYLKIDLISNNQADWATVWEAEIWGYTTSQTTIVNTKAYLQGCFNNNEMYSALNDSLLIPANQPYNSSPWNYSGNESVIPPEGAVDWILLELRSNVNSNSTVGRRAAFIMNDGLIVDLDGLNPVSFPLVPSGDYYIVVKHRNHLPIMSANKVALSPNYTFYDFTSSQNKAYGNQPMALLTNQKYGMYSGDGDSNGVINVMDYGTVGNNLFQTGYLQGDLDMSGTVNVLDYGKTNQNLLKVSSVP